MVERRVVMKVVGETVRIHKLAELEAIIGERLAQELDETIMSDLVGDPRRKLKPICPACGSDNVVVVKTDDDRFSYCGTCKTSF